MELDGKQGQACIQELVCRLELVYKLVLERALVLVQPCEQELGRRKQFLHIQLRLRFLSRHQQYCMLQFVYDHQVTKRGIDQMLSNHRGARFVQNLLRCSHLEQHIRIDKQLDHLHKLVLCHELELERGMVVEV